MEPRYPKSEPRPKLAMPVARIDIVLKERCCHLVKRCSLENPKRVITRRTREREVRMKRQKSTRRSSRNREIPLNDFGRCSCWVLGTGSFPLLIPASGGVCDVSETFDMSGGLDIIRRGAPEIIREMKF